jgi:hypothetical protein
LLNGAKKRPVDCISYVKQQGIGEGFGEDIQSMKEFIMEGCG